MRLSSPYLPAFRTVFPRRRIGESYSIHRAAPLFGLAGRDAAAFLTAFPFRWAGGGRGRLQLLSPLFLSVQSASRPSPRIAFRRAARCLPYYSLTYTAVGANAYFSRISVFTVDSAAACDTLTNRYTCGRGGTADTPDLGSGGEIRVGSNPTARTMATYSPPPQSVQAAAGAGFFYATETKIQSIRFRHGRNGRATSCT